MTTKEREYCRERVLINMQELLELRSKLAESLKDDSYPILTTKNCRDCKYVYRDDELPIDLALYCKIRGRAPVYIENFCALWEATGTAQPSTAQEAK